VRRIAIIGCSGTGKTRLANALGAKLELPVVHLDREFWQPGWVEPDKVDWAERVRELVSGDAWVTDGDFTGTYDIRLPEADTIVFLEASPVVCTLRVLRRWIRWRGRVRPDLAAGCWEQFDLKFLRYIWGYRHTRRPAALARIDALRAGRRVEVLGSKREVARFLESV
jgi:adenylate kinase family enzyme